MEGIFTAATITAIVTGLSALMVAVLGFDLVRAAYKGSRRLIAGLR